LEWREGSTPYYIETKEGYKVSKTFDATRIIYGAWAPREQKDIPNNIGYYPAPRNNPAAARAARLQARKACENHRLGVC
jgi:hypothetical protein